MDILPDDVLLVIFSFLPHHDVITVSQVCRRFHQLSSNGSLWKSVILCANFTFKNYKKGFLVSFFDKIGKYIEILRVDTESSLITLLSEVSCGAFNRLKELDLSSCMLTSAGCYDPYDLILNRLQFPKLESIATIVSVKKMQEFQESFYLEQLKKIKLNFTKPRKRIRTDNEEDEFDFTLCMGEILKDHPNLEQVSISCSLMVDTTIRFLMENLKHLTHLSLQGCSSLTSQCFSGMPVSTSLTMLNLDGTHVTDTTVDVLCNKCPNLKSLSLLRCQKITENSIVLVSNKCKYMEKLLFSGMKKAQNRCFSSFRIIGNLTYLKMLAHQGYGVLNVTDLEVTEICKCANLVDLELKDCRLVTDESVTVIGSNLNKLRSLKLGNCLKITSTGVQHVVIGCHQLKVLKMDSCKTLKGLCFPHQENGAHSHIIDLSLSKTVIGNEALQNIALMCPDIYRLDLSQSKDISDVSMEFLIKKCQLLTHLNITQINEPNMSYLWAITDKTLICISKYLPNLQFLGFRWNYKVTCNGLMEVIKHCRSLNKIEFSMHPELEVGIKVDEFFNMKDEIASCRTLNLKWTLDSTGAACLQFTFKTYNEGDEI